MKCFIVVYFPSRAWIILTKFVESFWDAAIERNGDRIKSCLCIGHAESRHHSHDISHNFMRSFLDEILVDTTTMQMPRMVYALSLIESIFPPLVEGCVKSENKT